MKKTTMQNHLEETRQLIAYTYAIKTGSRVDKSLDQITTLNKSTGDLFKVAKKTDKLDKLVGVMFGMYETAEHMIEAILRLDILDNSGEELNPEFDEDEDGSLSIEEIHRMFNINARWFNYLATEIGFVARPEIWHTVDDALNVIKSIDEELYDLAKALKDRDHDEELILLAEDFKKLSTGFGKIYELDLTTNADNW